MHIFLIIAGSILIVVAIGSMINRKSKTKELFTYGATESTSVKKLEELAKSISSDEAIGSGYFNKDVKISGTIYTDNPLKSKLAGVDCVWYSSEVKRVYEVERIERDDEGHTHTEYDRKEETISDSNDSTEFWIDDGSGKIKVSMQDLDYDTVEVYDEFKNYDDVKKQNYKIRFGGFEIDLSGSGGQDTHGTRTFGYRYRERALPIGRKVVVTGDARDVDGDLTLYKPQEDYLDFMLRFGTETEIVNKLKDNIKTMTKVATISGTIGLIVLIIGIIMAIL